MRGSEVIFCVIDAGGVDFGQSIRRSSVVKESGVTIVYEDR